MNAAKLDQWLEEHLPEYLEDLERLVNINSEWSEPQEGAPFGAGNAACAAAAMEIVERRGLTAKNYDYYAVTADLAPELPRQVDILAHLDVVPAGDGWTVTEPFSMKLQDGKVYGRGTADDKGPALCALYAMRAIRELGLPVKKNARLVMGTDEECGSRDLRYYFQSERSAPYSLSPDAEFPMINIEKGGLNTGFHADVRAAENGPRLVSLSGGLKVNVIPNKATAVLQDVTEEAVQAVIVSCSDMTDVQFSCEPRADGLIVTARGRTGHASEPQKASNAITGLLQLLAKLPLTDCALHDRIRAMAALFPHNDLHGAALGVDLEDAVSGKTVLSLTICSFSDTDGLRGWFDCRACLRANDSNTTDVVYRKLRAAGFEPQDRKMYAPHYVPEDSFLVQTLLDVYEDMTGQRPKPLCIGGGTYVHRIENGIAFGCGFVDLDNRIHGADEFFTLDQILFGAKIYARAILALCGA